MQQLPDIDFLDSEISNTLSYSSEVYNVIHNISSTSGSVPVSQPQIPTIPFMQQPHVANDAMQKQKIVQKWAQQQLLAQQQRIRVQQSMPPTAPTPLNVSAAPNMFVPTTLDFPTISTFDPNNMLDDIPDIPMINSFEPMSKAPESLSGIAKETREKSTTPTEVITEQPNVSSEIKEMEKTTPAVATEEILVKDDRNSDSKKDESLVVLDSDMSEEWKGFEYMKEEELKDILNSVSTFSKCVGDLRQELVSQFDLSSQEVEIKRQDIGQKAAPKESLETSIALSQQKQFTPPPQPRGPVVALSGLQAPIQHPVPNSYSADVPHESKMIPIWACYSCQQDGLPVAAYLHTNCAKCLHQRAALDPMGNSSPSLMQQAQRYAHHDTDSSSSRSSKKKRWIPRVQEDWRCSVCHRSDVTPAARKHCTGCYRRQLRERKAAAAANTIFY